jgi:Tfp pilus assembly protein PilV
MQIAEEAAVKMNRGVKAFTLAEVLVSVFLCAIMLTAVSAAISYGFSNVRLEREDLRATQILVEQMENLRLTRYENLQNYTNTAYYDPTATNGSTGVVYSVTFATNTLSASDLVAPGTPNPVVWYTNAIVRITATATWTNSNMQRSRTIQTYASKNGIQQYIYAPH